MAVRLPNLDRMPLIERRALQIQDPVERLRFLRGEMAAPQPRRPAAPGHAHLAAWRHLSWLILAIFLIVAARPTGTAETINRERRLSIPMAGVADVAAAVPRVWRVEHSEALELYSNGLQIDLTFVVSNRPRAHFPVFPLAGGADVTKVGTTPVGMVYHTTESHLAAFEERENRLLKQVGLNLLEIIRREHSYHYVIDRFGRVFRVVEETDAANHAGSSVWADADGIYVNLNDSFLGISFEGQTGATDEITAAQISSARILTEMLRSKYGIPAENCITHAQVSVNPLNMRIGAHTDWASKFPFAKLGLPDNYSIPLPSLYAFGFRYDEVFLHETGERWRGLDLAENQLERQAAMQGLSVAGYRAILRHRFKDIVATLKENDGGVYEKEFE